MLLIAVVFTYLCISGVFPHEMATQNTSAIVSPNFTDTNTSPYNLPVGVKEEILKISRDYIFTINKWEFDPAKNDTIILYVYDIRNESSLEDLQGKQIGNYTVQIIHDTEFETTRAEVQGYLNMLRKNPDYQIDSISMVTDRINDPPANNAELWVYKSTTEIQNLDHTIIKGWKIQVYDESPLPEPPTTALPTIVTPHFYRTISSGTNGSSTLTEDQAWKYAETFFQKNGEVNIQSSEVIPYGSSVWIEKNGNRETVWSFRVNKKIQPGISYGIGIIIVDASDGHIVDFKGLD